MKYYNSTLAIEESDINSCRLNLRQKLMLYTMSQYYISLLSGPLPLVCWNKLNCHQEQT